MAKSRPNVDTRMYDLAEDLLHGRFIDMEAQEDAIWKLAKDFQDAYEDFCQEKELTD